MNTSVWILLIFVAQGEKAGTFQIDGFESRAECVAQAKVAVEGLPSTLLSRTWTVCIERKQTR